MYHTLDKLYINYDFLIGIMGGGIQLGPLGMTAINRPILPAPSAYGDGEIDGMMICKGNQITRREPTPVPLCPPRTYKLKYLIRRQSS
jgi:hypothetical protein